MLKSKEYADQIESFISEYLLPKVSSITECKALSDLIKNSTEIKRRKVCDSSDRCLKFA